MPDTLPPCSRWPWTEKGKKDAKEAEKRHKGTLVTMQDDSGHLGYAVQLSSGRKVGPEECDKLDRNIAR